MNVTEQWDKVVSDKIGDLVTKAELEPESAEFYDAAMRPEAFVQKLIEEEQWADAVKVMSRSLPPAEAVLWACKCARSMDLSGQDEETLAALAAAERWAADPGKSTKRAAFEAAEDCAYKSAGMLAALAAGMNEDTIPIPDDQLVNIDPGSFHQTVVASVMSAVFAAGGDSLQPQFSLFLDHGADIARGVKSG